ncbi:MAG: hypothetical protein Q9164_002688 [Protoblastenia rupestris]
MAIRKLQHRQSYMAKAPYQRKSRKRAIGDAAMKLCPASWLVPTIIKAHENYEYRKDRKAKEEVYTKYQEKRKASVSTTRTTLQSSVDDMPLYGHPHREVKAWSPLAVDPLKQTNDPWVLPPINEIASLGTSAR